VIAAVTEDVGAMIVVERPDPGPPGPGQVVVAPEAVGICGSDYHIFFGELSEEAGGSLPRIQGHEVGGVILALGTQCRSELEVGQRVALLPIASCGTCYPCSVGRTNACDRFRLIGVHLDGGLQSQLTIGEEHVFPIRVDDGRVAAMAEPVSIAVRAVRRARVRPGERVVVLGAGPIGQCACLVARELGAQVLVVDRVPARLELAVSMGAETLVWSEPDDVVAAARSWTEGTGPAVVVDATGVPAAVRAMIEMVASAGRAVQVGMSGREVSLRLGSLTEKELDVLGVSCCTPEDFAEAVAVVERNQEAIGRLISHEFPLDRAPEAMAYAAGNPTDVMKVIIRP